MGAAASSSTQLPPIRTDARNWVELANEMGIPSEGMTTGQRRRELQRLLAGRVRSHIGESREAAQAFFTGAVLAGMPPPDVPDHVLAEAWRRSFQSSWDEGII